MPCICPLDGSTCWTCDSPSPRCAFESDAIYRIKEQARELAGVDIGFHYSVDAAVAGLIAALEERNGGTRPAV